MLKKSVNAAKSLTILLTQDIYCIFIVIFEDIPK